MTIIGLEPIPLSGADFKSAVAANYTISSNFSKIVRHINFFVQDGVFHFNTRAERSGVEDKAESKTARVSPGTLLSLLLNPFISSDRFRFAHFEFKTFNHNKYAPKFPW